MRPLTDAEWAVAHREHLAAERRQLDESELTPEEQAWCWAWVTGLYGETDVAQ